VTIGGDAVKDNALVKITAIICITALEIVNFLTMQKDSVITATVFTLIAGLAGYEFGRRKH